LLHDLREEGNQCYEHAEQCAGRARASQDEALRADYLRLAQGWLKLVQSYGLRQRLTPFINETAGRKNDLNQNTHPLASNYNRIRGSAYQSHSTATSIWRCATAATCASSASPAAAYSALGQAHLRQPQRIGGIGQTLRSAPERRPST
jgi:hypothetical protein